MQDNNRPPDEHDHGPTAQLLDEVWCLTCQHSHIATIPATTLRCASCGFGSWAVSVAEAHATSLPAHVVYPHHHQTIAAHPCGCPPGTTPDEHMENHHPTDTPGGY